MKHFPIGSRWIVYEDEDEVPHIYEVVDYHQEVGILITECNGQRYEWVPAILQWMGEPE